MSDVEFEIEGDDELLMHNFNTLPQNCQKFWKKRYDLFSLFDEGVYMTSELWYSVTPEPVGRFTAQLVKEMLPEAKQVVDVCCGGGGNTIQFAKYFDSVGGIDIKPINVKCTEHNASVYELENVWTVIGDWNELSKRDDWKVNNDLIDFMFCSPPWGGTEYCRDEMDMLTMTPFPVDKLLKSMLKHCDNIGLFLPRSSNLNQLRTITKEIFGKEGKCRVVYVYYKNHCPGLIAFFGKRVSEKYILYSSDVV